MNADEVRRRLVRLLGITAGAVNLPPEAFWVGDTAAERQVQDNIRSGRADWRAANRIARLGMAELDNGNVDDAEGFWRIAYDFYVRALESRIEPADIAYLTTGAKARGRPSKNAARNISLAQAEARQRKRGLSGKAAIQSALADDPKLAEEFRDISPSGIRDALKRGQRDGD